MFNFIYWNARGVGNRRTSTHLNDLIVRHRPNVLIIIEPEIDRYRLPHLAQQLDFPNYAHGADINCRIWLLWGDDISLADFAWGPYQVTVSISCNSNVVSCLCTLVHAPWSVDDQQELWDEFVVLYASVQMHWTVAGDFNSISSWDDKKGGNQDDDSMQAFNLFQISAGLTDVGYNGSPLAWSNNQAAEGRIWERLDRLIINGHALALLPNVKVTHLTGVHSDHCPLLVQMQDIPRRKAFFRYQKCWENHVAFFDFVRRKWEGALDDNPLTNFGIKLADTQH